MVTRGMVDAALNFTHYKSTVSVHTQVIQVSCLHRMGAQMRWLQCLQAVIVIRPSHNHTPHLLTTPVFILSHRIHGAGIYANMTGVY